MKEAIYNKMAEVEATHWWFRSRRAILRSFLDRLQLPPNARILEIGCGSGGNFSMLSHYGQLLAVESDPQALHYAQAKGQVEVLLGRLPDEIPFSEGCFDLVCLFDVLEHVEADERSLAGVNRLLTPAGWLVLTVPACQFLWSSHDEVHHHHRRYDRTGLVAKARAAGFHVVTATYFNTILFPLIAGVRWAERWRARRVEADLEVPSPLVNRALYRVMSCERHYLRLFTSPIGVSLLLVGSRHA